MPKRIPRSQTSVSTQRIAGHGRDFRKRRWTGWRPPPLLERYHALVNILARDLTCPKAEAIERALEALASPAQLSEWQAIVDIDTPPTHK